MTRMTVHMLGIMYFHVCEDTLCDGEQRQVLLPDGTKGDEHLPPHHASIFVEDSSLAGKPEWPWTVVHHEIPVPGDKEAVKMFEFRIEEPTTEVTFPDNGVNKLTMVDLDKGLVRIREVDPDFKPDLSGAGSVARVLIRSGNLQAYTFNGVTPVQWTIDSKSDDLKIVATHGRARGVISIKPQAGRLGSEVVLANAPNLLEQIPIMLTEPAPHDHGGNHDPDHDHFVLYNKIRTGNGGHNMKLPAHRSNLPSTHGLFKALEHVKMLNSCTPICCP